MLQTSLPVLRPFYTEVSQYILRVRKRAILTCSVTDPHNKAFVSLPIFVEIMEQENSEEALVKERNTTPDVKRTKRPRESGHTLSPPSKKTHHKHTSHEGDGASSQGKPASPVATSTLNASGLQSNSEGNYTEDTAGGKPSQESRLEPGLGVGGGGLTGLGATLSRLSSSTSSLGMCDSAMVDSFSTSMTESGEFSHELEYSFTDKMEDDQPVDDCQKKNSEEAAMATLSTKEKQRQSGEKRKRSHRHSHKRKQLGEAGKGGNRTMRPNYFVGIRISNACIHRSLIKVQQDLVAKDDSLMRSLVDVATSHITLLVAHLDTESAVAHASSVLEECAARLKDGVSVSPLRLTFAGVSNFSNQVVYARLVEDEQFRRLLDLAEYVRRVFGERGVCMPDTRDLHPHLTIAKLSKAPRVKGKQHGPRKIDPSSYRQHLDLYFGCQTVAGLQLLAMNRAKDDRRYYYCSKEVLFDVELEEDTNHSACCFPRRPILPQFSSRAGRSFSTMAAKEQPEKEEAPRSWFLPVVGVATALAGVLVLSYVVARLRGNQ